MAIKFIECIVEGIDITVGKTYEVLSVKRDNYEIVDDSGDRIYRDKDKFKVVEKKMDNGRFKIGSKIKCINNNGAGPLITLNKIYKVVDYDKTHLDQLIVVNDEGDLDNYFDFRFELVNETEEDYKEEELKALLIIANKGREALIKAYRMAPKRIVMYEPNKKPYVYGNEPKATTYGLKKIAKLEPFTINGWKVSYSDKYPDAITIGCKTFNRFALVNGLKDILEDQKPQSGPVGGVYENIKLEATRNSILCSGHAISYDDAETLYNNIKHLKD